MMMSRLRKKHLIKKSGSLLLAVVLLLTIISPVVWSLACNTEKPEGSVSVSEPAPKKDSTNTQDLSNTEDPTNNQDPANTEDSINTEDPTNNEDSEDNQNTNDEQTQTGVVYGFIWADGNGLLPTDWNGLYDSGEPPLSGIIVYLYETGDYYEPITSKKTPLATTITDGDGLYTIENLKPGSNTLGLIDSYINGAECL